MKIDSLTSDVLKDLSIRISKGKDPVKYNNSKDRDGFITGETHLLVIFTGTDYGLNESLTELVQARNSYGFSYDVGFSFSGAGVIGEQGMQEINRRLQPRKTFTEYDQLIFERVLEGVDGIIVPLATQDTISKLAYGIQDSFISTLLWQAIWRGMTVLVDFQSVRTFKGEETKVSFQAEIIQEHIERVKKLGIKELVSNEYITRMLNAFKNANIEVEPTEEENIVVEQKIKNNEFPKIITSKDLIELAGNTGSISIPPKTIVTPLAMDTAKEKGIKVLRRGEK
ncbi:MAG: hypothetical protein Q4P31_06090 [Andreesenia angusta]|nr:hypothetical protein [Andreesenia angusta]